MDEFIEKYRKLLVSTLFVVVSFLVAGYSIQYSSLKAYMSDLNVAMSQIREENAQLAQMQKQEEEQASKDREKRAGSQGIRYLPDFLGRINEIASNNEVIIHKLSPDAANAMRFKLDFVADYFTFIRFIAELERLDTILDDIQIHPYDVSKSPPIHAISFTIIPRNDAEPLAGKRLDAMMAAVQERDRRNPFQRFAYQSRERVSPVVDLTWVYKLGGVGVTPEGKMYATIDRKSYQEGDVLDGRIVTKIQSDRLSLEKKTKDGTSRYILTFRRKEKEK